MLQQAINQQLIAQQSPQINQVNQVNPPNQINQNQPNQMNQPNQFNVPSNQFGSNTGVLIPQPLQPAQQMGFNVPNQPNNFNFNPNQQNQQNQPNQPNQPNYTTPSVPPSTVPTEISTMVVPTFQQMQHMFQIWETMNQMGILKTTVQPKQSAENNSVVSKMVGQEIILPSGDKIVPLGNKKYGLIKKV